MRMGTPRLTAAEAAEGSDRAQSRSSRARLHDGGISWSLSNSRYSSASVVERANTAGTNPRTRFGEPRFFRFAGHEPTLLGRAAAGQAWRPCKYIFLHKAPAGEFHRDTPAKNFSSRGGAISREGATGVRARDRSSGPGLDRPRLNADCKAARGRYNARTAPAGRKTARRSVETRARGKRGPADPIARPVAACARRPWAGAGRRKQIYSPTPAGRRARGDPAGHRGPQPPQPGQSAKAPGGGVPGAL